MVVPSWPDAGLNAMFIELTAKGVTASTVLPETIWTWYNPALV
jgi:hypothetical protein